ncbi:N-acetyltransferase NAT13 [Stereum hirsutum FP-91666 SS1]|uniref:N-acetyltransferase NAT13 n=1 Tax=Stereum hirsutum (strain FP-91666) TaxID=721885 RepID=R7RWM4_STEHR|nr:N-acetyltransferase NAT13 [Stereum hirsutum FP-91666 SS1]EIM79178.1 N-acetyltransferase NAT13 [Stereum hirsutum FP-91666 SS1]
MTATKSHSARVSFASLTPNNLGTVRKLNSVLFPIKYSEKFYQDILLPEAEDFCKLGASSCSFGSTVYYNDIPVGTVCCRFETKDGEAQIYLMTMGVLAPYRSLGIGSQCLELIKNAASAYKNTKIRRIYLHVQISNEGAKQFYQRHGFTELGVAENYYKKITPRDAWILETFVEGQTSESQK